MKDPRTVRVTEVFETEKMRLSALFGVDLSEVTLTVKPMKSPRLGQAKVSKWTEKFAKVTINSNFFETWEGFRELVTDTVTHELVHVVNYMKNGWGLKPHGVEWKRLMIQAGKQAKATANISAHSVALAKYIVIKCKCGKEMHITKRKWSRKERYVHAKCGASLVEAIVVREALR